ncbi:MAG: discoidin domain-containing protein [Pirellulales bacterium]|nr:discoidin domain-containing protein [Pirellulales bacterium]
MRTHLVLVVAAAFLSLTLAATASAETINVALGGTATMSTRYSSSYAASKGVDGDYESRLVTAVGDEDPWWQVDLGQDTVIQDVWTYYPDTARLRQRAYNYTLQILDASDTLLYDSQADDGFTFNPWDGVNPANPRPDFGPAKFHLSTPVTGRKVRIVKDGFINKPQSYDEGLDAWECEVRQDDGLTGPNVAMGATVNVVGGDIFVDPNVNCFAVNLTDDTIGTWGGFDANQVAGCGYEIDMGESYVLDQIKVYCRQAANHVTGGAYPRLGYYRISLHDDDNGAIGDENWYTVLDDWTAGYREGGGLGIADVFTAADGTGMFEGQWIRIVATQDLIDLKDDYIMEISEVRAFAVPEPSTLALLAGLLAMGLIWRRS